MTTSPRAPHRSCHPRALVATTALAVLLAAVSAEVAARQAAAVADPPAGTQVPAPEAFFGFRMGTDGKLARWSDIERYFTRVASSSDRIDLVSLGTTTEGQNYFAAIISAPEHLARLDEIKRNNLRLADPRALAADDARPLFDSQPAVVVIGASIHASEIGATQAASELLHELATSNEPRVLEALRSLVIILMPSLNPDGHRLVVDWFERNVATPFEASPMPWLYHKYAGHDINRDAFMLNLTENRRLAQFFYREWHPQVFLTMHQMGQRGPRFFVPPNYDPIDRNYDPLVWRTAGLLGNAMALQLERDGKAGVVQNALFDYYWPGYEDSAPLGHNTVCLLTEVASVRVALPVDIKETELTGSPRGLPEYRSQVNFPNPWRGGTWRLRDIVEYDISAVRGLIAGASRYRRELLENFYAMGARAVGKGLRGGPFAFLMPMPQYDPHATSALVDLLRGAAVDVHQAVEPFRAGGREYAAGTIVVPMAQPFSAYVKTLLEPQEYPVRRLVPGGPPERPYDVAGWTLPYQMGVTVDAIEDAFELPAMSRVDHSALGPAKRLGERTPSYFAIDARGNGGALAINRLQAGGAAVQWLVQPLELLGATYPSGTLILPASSRNRSLVERVTRDLGLTVVGARGNLPRSVAPIARPRIGLYKPWVENIDEGWTRWLLERYEFAFTSLTDADMRAGRLLERVDAIILPDGSPERLIAGHAPGTVPEQYVGGLGEPGVASLRAFVKEGGTLICLDSSCGLVMDALDLPVKDVVRGIPPEKFFCPGSILRLRLDPTNPIAFGLPEQTSAFFAMSSAYEVVPPASESTTGNSSDHGTNGNSPYDVRPVGWYGSGNPLMSGWLEGPEQIADKGAVIEARIGRGRAVLLGFRAQHRAQSHATFRLLFNSLYTHPSPTRTRPPR